MKLFFSHSSANKPLLREIRSHFPSWIQSWIDEEQLLFGSNLFDSLQTAVNSETDYLILFFCDEASKSDWVRKEIEWALERERELDRIFLLPVLLDESRDKLNQFGLEGRLTINLTDYSAQGAKDTAARIVDHIGGWMSRQIDKSAIVESELKKKIRDIEHAMNSTLNSNTGVLSDNFPYSIKKYEKEVEFTIDGAGKQVTRWIDLRAKQSFTNLEIPWNFIVEQADSAIGDTIASEIEPSSGCVQFVDRRVYEIDDSTKEVRGKFKILGHFGVDSEPVSFECAQMFEGAFQLTRESALKQYENTDWPEEYTSSTSIAAMQALSVQVIFPEEYDFKTAPSPVAFIGKTHHVHELETTRIRDGFAIDGRKVTLNVDNPAIGLRYAISWMPPFD